MEINLKLTIIIISWLNIAKTNLIDLWIRAIVSQIKLSNDCTIAKYKKYKNEKDTANLSILLYERLNERFISPILDVSKKQNGHGFAMMAIACLTIEAFQAFKVGHIKSKPGFSQKAFIDFFSDHKEFGINVKEDQKDFYINIRCGILHDAETRNRWKILRSNLLYDRKNRSINATKFLKTLRKTILTYSKSIETVAWSDPTWKNIIMKFDSIVNKST